MSYFNINRVVHVGRLTREPELRALPSGRSVCSLRVACNSARRDSDGEMQERPNFFDVNVYGAAADSVANYMHRGSRVGIDGRLAEIETLLHTGRRVPRCECGAPVLRGSRFCPNCGRPLGTAERSPEDVSEETVIEPAPRG